MIMICAFQPISRTHFTYPFDEKTLKTPSARLVKVLNYIISELQWCLKAEESVEDVTSHLSNMSLIVAGGAINESELIHKSLLMLNSSQNNFNIENETNDENIHFICNQLINKLLIIKSV